VIDQQIRHNDCGISSVKTVFNILGKDISREYIKSEIFLDEFGSRLTDVKAFFDANECDTILTLLDVNTTKNKAAYFDELFPFIVPVKNKNGLHYIVVNGLKNDKLKVYDPAKVKTYYISLPELKKIAHFSDSYLEQVSMQERLTVLINDELSQYQIETKDALKENDVPTLFNKLTYFGYFKENYPFAKPDLEKTFLLDLIYNQEIQFLPEHFRSLNYNEDKIKITAPLVLSVKAKDQKPIVSDQDEDVKENVYVKLLKGLKSNKKLWYIYIFTAIFAASITQLAVFINQILIDKVLPSFQLNILILFAIGVGIFRIFNLVISLYRRFIGIHLGNILDKYFLGTFDQKLNDFSISFIQTFRRGDLTERLSDSRKLKSFFLRFFTKILVDVVVSLYSLFLLAFIHWKLTMVVVVVMILFYIWFRVMTPILKTNEMKRFVVKANFFSTMIEKIEGIQVIKSFKIEHIFSNKVNNNINNLIDIQTKVRYYNMLNSAVVSLITISAGLLILTLLSKDAIENQSITLGQIITFLALTTTIFSTLSSILNENLTLQENLVILKRYFDFNDKEVRDTTDTSNTITNVSVNTVNFDNVTFEYLPGKPILDAINISINKGDKIKIEGRNGSGKSTFCKVLSLLYEPTDGEIKINNISSELYSKDILRKKVLLVSNEDILFNDTLQYNITFNKKVPVDKLISTARRLDFYDYLTSNSSGLDHRINENGRNLSTGQRKKILLMRALLSEAEVIILDEVLSGIDASSRKIIEETLTEIDKTILVVSHEATEDIKFNKSYTIEDCKLIEQTI